ncbi:UDP-N-acetylglucosamine transferase subunit ALG14 [Abortiporus biennis]
MQDTNASFSTRAAWAVLAVITIVALRIYCILPRPSVVKRTRRRKLTCALGVFLGSGGHTSEAIALMSALDFSRYTPRTYFVSEGDILSAKKALAFESEKAAQTDSHSTLGTDPRSPYGIFTIPRARRVHQSLFTTPFTALRSVLSCIYYITLAPLASQDNLPEVLILNGPGTACVLCVAVYVNKFLGLASPRLIYVESFARVGSLSLSGKLLRPFVDRFIVQWPDLAKERPGVEYRGWLV